MEYSGSPSNFDALMLGSGGVYTSSTSESRSITTPAMTDDQQSVGWAQSATYQRIYINGIEKSNNTNSYIYQYSYPNLVLNGVGKFVYEVLLYNYDMMQLDFERSAQDQLATFKYRQGWIPCTGGQWDSLNANQPPVCLGTY